MGCGVCCLKCLLILFNVLFGIIGAVLLGAGAFILAAVNKTLGPYVDKALDSLPGLPGSFNLRDSAANLSEDLNLDIEKLLHSVAVFLVIFGVLLLVCSILGSFGACCSNKIMLFVYAGLVLLLFLIQLILVICFFTGALDKTIKKKMKATITKDYVGVDDYGIMSLAWNVMMTKLKCCGVDNYEDFLGATKWKKERQFEFAGIPISYTLQTPFCCCKFNGEFPGITPVTETCAVFPTILTSNYLQGCWTPLWDAMSSFRTTVVGAVAGILVFQALCGVAAIAIGVYIDKEKSAIA